MLSEEKIKKMIRLSDYENGQGATDLRRTRFLQMDYVRLQLLKTIVSVVVAAILIAVLLGIYNMEYILVHAMEIPYRTYFFWYVSVMLVVLVISVIVSGRIAAKQYRESLIRVKEYHTTLKELAALYESEEQEDNAL